MRVSVVCRNLDDDRVIPRFARYLRDRLGWTLARTPDPTADAVYLSGYFEAQVCPTWPQVPVGALFTHREEEPPGNSKAKLYDAIARRVQLRVAMCRLYAEPLSRIGPTLQAPLPVERGRFTIPAAASRRRLVCGFSGYTYSNHRKGEDLVRAVLASKAGQSVEWRASGRGWPVPTKRYAWRDMPGFYQGLDVLVCTSRVEGGPMPPLEALACGVSVVVPRGVGIIDELADVAGIHRYKRGDAADMVKALGKAIAARGDVDREALRAVTEGMTVEAWCRAHEEAFMEISGGPGAGLEEPAAEPEPAIEIRDDEVQEPTVSGETSGTRGIYCVAFGAPARACAQRLMETVREHLPEIPIAFCGAEPLGLEDVFIAQPDSDVGGRRAKLKAYELSPWDVTLYLDVDTEVISGDARFWFELIEDGWEFAIAKDPHLHDTLHQMQRVRAGASFNPDEYEETTSQVMTAHTLMYNGGVWAFGRNERVAAFFERWQAEWEKHGQRDQPGLVRAMYTDPLRTYVLGNEWNMFPKHSRGVEAAAIKHYPGRARRWNGFIPGRIDSAAAWSKVKQFEARSGGRARGRR